MPQTERDQIEFLADEAIREGEPVFDIIGGVKIVAMSEACYQRLWKPGDEPLIPALYNAQGTNVYMYRMPGGFGYGKSVRE